MTKKGKIFDSLCEAFPLKNIRDDRHLEAALVALHKVKSFIEKNPKHTEQATEYLQDLEKLIQEYKKQQSVH